MSFEILQIVPKLPPSFSGVGDYALLLARELRAAHNIDTRFLVCDPNWSGQAAIEGFKIETLKERRSSVLEQVLSKGTMPSLVLLHYVGYGYEKRGCPIWLTDGLREWRISNQDRRLMIMFHELHAFGPPWRSSFWVSYLQKSLVVRLAESADTCVTNLKRYAIWLERRVPRHQIKTIPVFSNVGELADDTFIGDRKPIMIVFGGARWVKELFGKYRAETAACCKAFEIEKIMTVGSPLGSAPNNLPIGVRELGYLGDVDIADIMKSSRVGMMNYFPGYLAKSGVYAAYSALGLVPILPKSNPSSADGCIEGKTYLTANGIAGRVPHELLEDIVGNARKWYETHSVARTANLYSDLIRRSIARC